MLVKGLNDDVEGAKKVAEFIREIKPSIAYLSIPIRPPAEKWVEAPGEEKNNRAYQIFRDQSITTEYLIGYEGNEFAYTGNTEEDILSITSVTMVFSLLIHGLQSRFVENWIAVGMKKTKLFHLSRNIN